MNPPSLLNMELFEHIFTSTTLLVLCGTGLLGVACGAVGTFMLLRERALVGDALAHASLPGVCVSFLIFRERGLVPLVLGAVAFGVMGVWMISGIRAHSRIKEDAAIGIVLSSLFGLGISLSRLIQNLPGGNRAGLDDFIFGKAATISHEDVLLISIVSLVSVSVITLLRKEFKLLCFDRIFCSSQGFSARALDLILLGLVCACTGVGLPAVGAVLISALLIIPAATARLWTDRLEHMLILACSFGLLACLSGTILSAIISLPLGAQSHGLPTGPLIIVSAAILFLVSLLMSPKHGILHQWRKRATS